MFWLGFCWICVPDADLLLWHPLHSAHVCAASPKWPHCRDKTHRRPESSPASCLQSPRLFSLLAATPLAPFVLEVLTAHVCPRSQVPVQPVTAAGPEHSKPLEKAESLFNQERDPRFGEIYSGINTGEGCWAVRHGQQHVASSSNFRCSPSALCSFLSHPEQFWVL